MTKVKICGMMRAVDIEMASGADYLGFVVGSRSARNLEVSRARELMSTTDRKRVVVTTASDLVLLALMANELEPEVMQLHSVLRAEALEAFSNEFSGSVWALVQVGGGDEAERLRSVQGMADAILLDTKSPRLGGQGIPHDWAVSRRIRDMASPLPVVLAGGLGPDNVQEAARAVRPFCVDTSSGVERHGAKDLELIIRFIERAREVED